MVGLPRSGCGIARRASAWSLSKVHDRAGRGRGRLRSESCHRRIRKRGDARRAGCLGKRRDFRRQTMRRSWNTPRSTALSGRVVPRRFSRAGDLLIRPLGSARRQLLETRNQPSNTLLHVSNLIVTICMPFEHWRRTCALRRVRLSTNLNATFALSARAPGSRAASRHRCL